MTFQTDQIQAILTDINVVLNNPNKFPLRWWTSVEAAEQRRVLERVRTYLQVLQQQLTTAAGQMPTQGVSGEQPETVPLQALQTEVEALRQQREALTQEIQQLEQQRQNYIDLTQQPAPQQQIIAAYLQVLTGRLQESLTQQLPQTLSQLAAQEGLFSAASNRDPSLLRSGEPELGTEEAIPPAQAEELQKQQARLARLLKTLDSKLNLMFENLQRNLYKYQMSLSQGLTRMQGISGQSEEILAELIAYLTQDLETKLPAEQEPLLPESASSLEENPEAISSSDLLPYAGAELHQPGGEPGLSSPKTEAGGEERENRAIPAQPTGFALTPAEASVEEVESFNPFASPLIDTLFASSTSKEVETSAPEPTLPISPYLQEFVIAENSADLPLSQSDVSDERTNAEKTQATNSIRAAEPVETISSLTDLLDLPALGESLRTVDTMAAGAAQATSTSDEPSSMDVSLYLTRDNAVPVTAKEELLIVNEAIENEMELWLGVKTLQQLNEDLSSLETADSQSLPVPTEAAHLTPSPTETQPDLNPFSTKAIDEPDNPSLAAIDAVFMPQPRVENEPVTHLPGGIDFNAEAEADDFTVTLEDEASDFAIPEDVLAEFEDLFADSLSPVVTEPAVDLIQPPGIDISSETQKNLAPTPLVSTNTEEERKSGQDDESGIASPVELPRYWYLGMDWGTTGLSAVLLNAKTRQFYPLFWVGVEQMHLTEPLFRLPAVVYWQSEAGEAEAVSLSLEQGIWLQNFKPYLKITLPYYSAQRGHWEPCLQWSDEQSIALYTVQQALQALVATLNPNPQEESRIVPISLLHAPYSIGAEGLDEGTLYTALEQLAGISVSCPADWSEAYRFNVRESILAAGLVSRPDQICFVEEAIASLLTQFSHTEENWQGNTLIVQIGATTTEFGLVDLPTAVEDLTYSDFCFHSFAYAGNAIDLDIICQLLYPTKARTKRPENEPKAFGSQFPSWNWQAENLADLPQFSWESLGLDNLTLPQPGEPDLVNRYRLQQRLQSSPLGQALLEAAKHVKLILPQQNYFTLDLGQYRWVLRRQDLETLVLIPLIQRLNRELNTLLVRQGVTVEAIRQAICTGGTTGLSVMARWLRQKLPNATIVNSSDYSGVARGLAAIPFYPQVLDTARQQYNDYFLLLELIRTFGDQSLSVGRMRQLLEHKGINTNTCQQRILAFLAGDFPAGIVPAPSDTLLLSPSSLNNPDYPVETENSYIDKDQPLFIRDEDQTYRLNPEQRDRLNQYFHLLLARTQQNLDEPYAVYWITPVNSSD